jgi:hypothetical protein
MKPVRKHAMKKVALLCDIQGLWWGATKYNKGRVDYTKLMRAVGDGRNIVAAGAWLLDRDGMDKFVAALRFIGYETNVLPRGAMIDQLICAAAIEASHHVDVIAIAASSGRYNALIEHLGPLGKELEIWAFPVQCPLDELQGKVARWHQLGDQVTLAAS